MSTKDTKTLLQQQFTLLNKRRDEILAVSVPLREKRDLIKNTALEKARELDGQITQVEKDLFDIDKSRAMLARALGGKFMSDATK